MHCARSLQLLALLTPVCLGACVSNEPVPSPGAANGQPGSPAMASPRQSLMTAGSLSETFKDVSTIGFYLPERSRPEAEPQSETERALIEGAIREAVREHFTKAGYVWAEDDSPQRTVQIAFLLTPELSIKDLDELYSLAPGFLSPESAERGVIALAFSWPGRAEPVCRVLLDGVVSPDAPIEKRLAAIPDAVKSMFAGLPVCRESHSEPVLGAQHVGTQ